MIATIAAERIALAKERMAGQETEYRGLGGEKNATFSVYRDTGGTTSVGRKRLIAMSSDQDVYDERLWMKVANLTGAAGNSTALVGTPNRSRKPCSGTTTSGSLRSSSRVSTRCPTWSNSASASSPRCGTEPSSATRLLPAEESGSGRQDGRRKDPGRSVRSSVEQ